MRQRVMPMPVRVTPDLFAPVLVMFVMAVLVLVFHRFVRVQMLVPFGQMQPYSRAPDRPAKTSARHGKSG